MTRSLPDADLVSRSLSGDDSAFPELVRRHTGLVERIVRPIIRHGSADVVQATFLSVWLGRRQFDPARGSFTNWVGRIARNRAVDALRSERRHRGIAPLSAIDGTPVELVCPAERPDDAATRRAEACSVRAAVAGLADEQRAVIGLAYYGGLSQSEIHHRLGIPLGTVKGRCRLALAAMQRELSRAT